MEYIAVIGYLIILAYLALDYRYTKRKYHVNYNGSRYVVRDSKGRFVAIRKSFWDILTIYGDL